MIRCYRWKLSLNPLNPSRSCGLNASAFQSAEKDLPDRGLYIFCLLCASQHLAALMRSFWAVQQLPTLPSPIPNSWIVSWGVYGGSPSPQVMAFNPKLIDFSMRVGPGSHELNPFFRRRIATGRVFFATAPWKPCLVIRTSWPSPMKRPTFASTCPSDLRIIPMEEQ